MLILLALMATAQGPAAAPAPVPSAPVTVTGDKKPKRVCQLVDVSGSRMRQRVCKDEQGVEVGGTVHISDAASNPGMFKATPGPAGSSLGGASPQ
jgi:hypothetical protein